MDDDSLVDKEKRKKEVEDKLQILKDRKHKLVQVLKQVMTLQITIPCSFTVIHNHRSYYVDDRF